MTFAVVGGTQDTSYEISNSLRFNDDDDAVLDRGSISGTLSKAHTFSLWVKRSTLDDARHVLAMMGDGSGDISLIEFNANSIRYFADGAGNYAPQTTAKYRDVSAWYHIVVKVDTTQSSASDRLKIYVNGTEQAYSGTPPPQNHQADMDECTVGFNPGDEFDGYMAEFHFLDGVAYDPTYFGQTDSNGVWIPKEYTGGNYGTFGFYLQFKETGTSANSSGMGADTSGNDNHFSATNLAATDVTTDTPTNNFCTLNSLSTRSTLSEGNLKYLSPQGATTSTIAVANGQWYMEFLIVTQGGILSGFVESSYSPIVGTNQPWDHGDGVFYYTSTGQKAFGTSQFADYAATSTNGDIIGVAIDIDNNTIQFYKNGSALGSISNTFTDGAFYTFVESDATTATNSTGIVNFGHDSSFAGQKTAQNNSDENGYGDFYYTPPSGYYAICTKNLAEFG